MSCSCSEGMGTQRCLADGRGWGACACVDYGTQLAVSPSGSDSAAGTLAAPFRTLQRAQAAVRDLQDAGPLPDGGVVIWLRGGSYNLTSSLALTAADSATPSAPVVYRGYPGETARVMGGMELDAGSAQWLTSASPVWSRLDPSAQGQVVSYDLTALGISDFGTLTPRGFGQTGIPAALELFIDGQRAPLGRWPDANQNDPNISTPSIDAGQVTLYGTGVQPDVTGVYVMTGTQDGASSFTRQGQVNGKTWNLYRASGSNGGQPWEAWFLTTSTSGYPSGADPFWYIYQASFGTMTGTQGGTGALGFINPAAVNNGFEPIATADPTTNTFTFATDRTSRWTEAPDPWTHGFFTYPWADAHLPLALADAGAGSLTLGGTPFDGLSPTLQGGGASLAYAYNLLEEITQPGEWYLDRKSGLLYLWPPTNLASHDVVVSLLSAPLVTVTGTHDVTFQEITFEASRTQLISVSGGASNIQLVGCTLRDSGDAAATVGGSSSVVFDGDLIYDTGEDGVQLGGGDRATLTPGNNVLQNSEVHDFSQWVWTYTPAANLTGDGNAVLHNRIHGAPHSAILFGTSSQQLIQYNDIYDVLSFTSDCGVIYAWSDWARTAT